MEILEKAESLLSIWRRMEKQENWLSGLSLWPQYTLNYLQREREMMAALSLGLLARTRLKMGEVEKGDQIWKKAKALASGDPESTIDAGLEVFSGEILLAQGENSQARKVLAAAGERLEGMDSSPLVDYLLSQVWQVLAESWEGEDGEKVDFYKKKGEGIDGPDPADELPIGEEVPEEEAFWEEVDQWIEENVLSEEDSLQETLNHVQNKRLTMAVKSLPQEKTEGEEGEEGGEEEAEREEGEGEKLDPERAEILEKAEDELAQGNYNQAREMAEKVLESNPKNERARKIAHLAGELRILMQKLLDRAFQYEKEGNFREALGEWEKILEMAPNHPKVVSKTEEIKEKLNREISQKLDKISQLFEKAQYRMVLVHGQELLKEAPDHPEGLNWVEKAKNQLKKADNFLSQAQRAFHEGDLNKARSFARDVLEIDPRKEEAQKIIEAIEGPQEVDSEEEKKKKKVADQLVECARELMDIEAYSSALAVAEEVLNLAPGRSDAMEIMRKIRRQSPGLVEKARDMGTSETTVRPKSLKTRSKIDTPPPGKDSLDEEIKDLEDAEEKFTRILERRQATRVFTKPPSSSSPSADIEDEPTEVRLEDLDRESLPPSSSSSRQELRAFFEESLEDEGEEEKEEK